MGIHETGNFSGEKLQHLPSVASGITSYRDYIEQYGSDNRRKSVTEKLGQLESALFRKYGTRMDPVIYIMELYFGENPISADGVMKELQTLGINYNNVNSVLSLMNRTFGWELRECSARIDSTVVKREDCEQAGGERLSQYAQLVVDETNAKAEEIIGSILGKKTGDTEKIKHFDRNLLHQKESKKLGKVFYILETFRGISFEDVVAIYSEGVSIHLIVKNLQIILDEICESQKLGIKLQIHENGIIYRLKERGVYKGKR